MTSKLKSSEFIKIFLESSKTYEKNSTHMDTKNTFVDFFVIKSRKSQKIKLQTLFNNFIFKSENVFV